MEDITVHPQKDLSQRTFVDQTANSADHNAQL
ncbi:hypothetical protein Gorai_017704 [Gossypium raimondii]|uniref:Uncharacterized protein n=1 Tax=Gossypium raimondii TaxID=29730 RepID=A0A7J8PIJ8_GOSRA|nr:hypothetical protein [Gossypium raimondii]